MSGIWWFLIALVGLIFAGLLMLVAAVLGRRWQVSRSIAVLQRAKAEFRLRREWLETQFLTVASRSGKPRGLAWADCEFHDDVSFARDRQSGALCALVGVAISFEAIEGGGMEDNPNVDNMKAGSAVFRYDGHQWTTDGRALLNLDPYEAIERLHNELELVE